MDRREKLTIPKIFGLPEVRIYQEDLQGGGGQGKESGRVSYVKSYGEYDEPRM
jgi:hypothetical protein